MAKHAMTKIRREPVRRWLRVVSKEHITPLMLRVIFASDELAGFESPSPDDHIKIFLPGQEGGEPVMRDFTPRAWDVEAGTMTLEFALHPHGTASDWAKGCRVGDTLEIGGPRGSTVAPDDFDWYLLVGDAAALPSIGRRLGSLRDGVPVIVIALVAHEDERQVFESVADCQVHWLPASGSLEQDAAALRTAVEGLRLPDGDGYVWIAAEDSVARGLYEFAVHTLQHPKEWVKAAGYWHA